MLQLCVSQNINDIPYTFKATGIRVYSIEEALYHAYHHWRESIDELLTEGLSTWIASLCIPHIATKMKTISATTQSSKRLLAFLGITEYFSQAEINALKADLERWEHRVEWEKLKDRADNLVARGEPAKALALYSRALNYGEKPALLNNMGIANMQLSNHQEAAKLLARAHTAQPENTAITLHYAEALILNGDYENAAKAIQKAKTSYHTGQATIETADVQYLQGLMAYRQKDYDKALAHLQAAAALNPEASLYTHKLAETYQQLNQHDKAIATLEQSPTAPHHEKLAEIYATNGHTHKPEAIRHIRQAISEGNRNNPTLWAKLAQYYRQDYDNQRANEAITQALPSTSPPILLENARIKKSLGRMRDYRVGLSDALRGLVAQYRD